MGKAIIYGQSDDLIELRGDIHDEVYASLNHGDLVCFDDNTVLCIEYDGTWNIETVIEDESSITIYDAGSPTSKDHCEYSDVAVVRYDGDVPDYHVETNGHGTVNI